MKLLRLGWVLVAAFATLVVADDTDLYLGTGGSTAGVRPQVLIIFDTSGSMEALEPVAAQPFNPDWDYIHNRDGDGNHHGKLYYIREGVDLINYPNPSEDSERRYLEWGQNACAESFATLRQHGLYTDNVRRFQYGRNKQPRWRRLPDKFTSNNRGKTVIDCLEDMRKANAAAAPNHPHNNLRGTGFPQVSSREQPFDGTLPSASYEDRKGAADVAIEAAGFGGNDSVTLLTENYLTWLHSSGTTELSRIAIARNTITSLVQTTPGVDFGLEVFNYTQGGRIVEGIREMTDANKQDLISTVGSLVDDGATPLCESLFEANRYFGGKNAIYGQLSGSSAGTPDYDPTAFDGNRYNSPLVECHPQSYVVLITDGQPTYDNDLDSQIKSELDLTESDYYHFYNDDGWRRKNLMPAVAGWMHDNDVNPDVLGEQNIVTYTIGFSEGADAAAGILHETAMRGGGQYYAASDAMALQAVLQKIFSEILSINASFTSPSIAANSYDRTQTLDAVYYAMFLPDDRPRWQGNLKKLRIDSEGKVVDTEGFRAINSRGNIMDGACTFWTDPDTCALASSSGDGNDVAVGGALESVINQPQRILLTDNAAGNGDLVTLSRTSLAAAVGGDEQLQSILGADSTQVDGYVQWLQGIDVDDEDEDGQDTDRRFDIIGDPLHSKPLALHYGDGKGVRILMGTNHGYLHMLEDKGDSVEESWAYYLSDLLPRLPELRTNPVVGQHSIYGVDGSATAYLHDRGGDGEIDAGVDKAWLFVGLRRGGSAYYALDISDPDRPSKMWSIDSDDAGFGELGQSWSEPLVTRLPGFDGKPVLVIGAGYDVNKDIKTLGTPDSEGRGVLVVDAETGRLLHQFVPANSASAGITPMAIEDSVPSRVTALDSDMDGVSDRLYVTDTGGNVWRIDMPHSDPQYWSAFKFAELGNDWNQAEDRRFFAEVSVAQTVFEQHSTLVSLDPEGNEVTMKSVSEVPFDAVAIGSGNRSNPNGSGTQNYLFMLQDRYVLTQTFGTTENPAPATLTKDNLYDMTADPVGTGSDSDKAEAQLGLGSKLGWYVQLEQGEKSLSAPVIVAGMVYYTTFKPGSEAEPNACLVAGEGRLYVFGLHEAQQHLSLDLGITLPDTPQIIVPPQPGNSEDDQGSGNTAGEWEPIVHLIGVGPGEEQKGSIATGQSLAPSRIYYHQGVNP